MHRTCISNRFLIWNSVLMYFKHILKYKVGPQCFKSRNLRPKPIKTSHKNVFRHFGISTGPGQKDITDLRSKFGCSLPLQGPIFCPKFGRTVNILRQIMPAAGSCCTSQVISHLGRVTLFVFFKFNTRALNPLIFWMNYSLTITLLHSQVSL